MYIDMDGNHDMGGNDNWGDYATQVIHFVGPNNTDANVIATKIGTSRIFEVIIPKGAWTAFLIVRCNPDMLDTTYFSNMWNDGVKWAQTSNIEFQNTVNMTNANVTPTGKESYQNYLTSFKANSYDVSWGEYPTYTQIIINPS